MDIEQVVATIVRDHEVDRILEHHGVKGMKWGVRRAPSAAIESAKVRRAQNRSPEVTVLDRGRKLKTRGGRGHLAHPDAVTARTLGQKGKASGLKSLSNKELETYARRLQLEQNVTRLNQNEQGAGRKFLRGFMKENGNNTAKKVGKKGLAIAGKKAIMTAGKIALVA